MLKIIKTNYAFSAIVTLMMTMPLNACGEKTMTIPNATVYSFDHKVPESFHTNPDLSSEEFQPFMDEGIFFWGGAMRNIGNTSNVEFDVGVQFNTETVGRKIFIEKMVLDTSNLKRERVINEFVDIDVFGKTRKLYFKRFMPFKKISGDSIPLTADSFTLSIDYRLDDKPTKKMSIKFDNTTFLAPIL